MVVQRAASASEGWGGANCLMKVLLGSGYSGRQRATTRQSGSDGRGVGAAGAMGVPSLKARRRELMPLAAI